MNLTELGNHKVRFVRSENVTVTLLFDKKGRFIGEGRSDCSACDEFNKDKGRRVSLARALKNTKLKKSERTLIWEGYRTMTKKPRW